MSEKVQGLLTKGITLSKGDTVLPGLQETPEIGSTPEKVEVTTLDDSAKRYIAGLDDYGDLAFKFLYDNGESSAFRILSAAQKEGAVDTYKVAFPDGTSFSFEASVAVKVDSATANNPLTFTATLTLNSEITVGNPTT